MSLQNLALNSYLLPVFSFDINNGQLAYEHICRSDFFAVSAVSLCGQHGLKIGLNRGVAVAAVAYLVAVYIPFIENIRVGFLDLYAYRHTDLSISGAEIHLIGVFGICFSAVIICRKCCYGQTAYSNNRCHQ